MCKLCDKEFINNHEHLVSDDSTTIPIRLEYLDGIYFIRMIYDDYDWECIDVNYCPYCGRNLYKE